jgi:head-tail adaptor
MDLDTKISDLKFRVALCSSSDVVESGGIITLTRTAIAKVWAAIYAQPHIPSFISREGYAIKETADRYTHKITVRYKVDLDITSAAWVYEERLKSPPRWYKVLGFYDNDNWINLQTHLVERSVNATEPRNPLSADPAEI